MSAHGLRLLVVEDNEDDVYILRRSISKTQYDVSVEQVPSGQECLDFLRADGRYANATHPDLILLDINMPIMDGKDVLAALAADERLRHIPVVVLTTSESRTDILDAYRLQCNSFITKPVDFKEYHAMIEQLLSYWICIVQRPENIALGTKPRMR